MTDRQPRYYSLTLVPEAPGGLHHPNCPCCRARTDLEWVCRQVVGMRGARISDRRIRLELERAYPTWMVDDALTLP